MTLFPSFFHLSANLPDVVVFPGAVQAQHQNFGRMRGKIERPARIPQQVNHFVLHPFDDLLSRRDAARHFFAHTVITDPVDEILGHLIIHIGFQQRQTDVAQRVFDVAFRRFP